jgi:hypothetical protein
MIPAILIEIPFYIGVSELLWGRLRRKKLKIIKAG